MIKNKNKETVCAVVVTYNRKKLLLECLEALKNQTRPLDSIYLIDNTSTDGTPELLLEKGYIKELPPKDLKEPWEKTFNITLPSENEIPLHYVRMHENTGGAGGFYEGVKRGYKRGYDWLWLMDDDAEPYTDTLEKLDDYLNKEDIFALANVPLLSDGSIALSHRGRFKNKIELDFIPVEEYNNKDIIDIEFASFVGLLIRKSAIKKIGFPKKEFFINGDDLEYCLRLSNIGKIKMITSSKILHKEKAKVYDVKSFLGRESNRIPYDKFWLYCISFRNHSFLYKTKHGLIKTFIVRGKDNFKKIIGILIYDDKKLKRIKCILSSFKDGLTGKFKNYKNLYKEEKNE